MFGAQDKASWTASDTSSVRFCIPLCLPHRRNRGGTTLGKAHEASVAGLRSTAFTVLSSFPGTVAGPFLATVGAWLLDRWIPYNRPWLNQICQGNTHTHAYIHAQMSVESQCQYYSVAIGDEVLDGLASELMTLRRVGTGCWLACPGVAIFDKMESDKCW